MAALLVAYDLNRETVRPQIVKLIGDNWNWARLSESSYAIEADNPHAVYAKLRPLLDDNDNLYVIPLKKPYAGWGPKAVHEWLESKLTH